MKVKDLIRILQNYYDDTAVFFYNWRKGDDMYLKDISEADDSSEIYFNIY